MKRLFLLPIAMIATVVALSSCSEDSTESGSGTSANAVPLSYELSASAAQAGDEVDVIFKVTSSAVTEEAVSITLSAVDGSTDVSSTYFVDFPSSVTFPEGEDEFSTTLTLKSDISIDTTYKVIELQAYARGYSISGGTTASSGAQSINLSIYDHYVTSVALKSGTSVTEGETFSLIASIPVAGEADVVVSVSYSGSDYTLTDLPSSLTIVAGETSVESGAVTVELDGVYAGDTTATLDLSTTSQDFPMESAEFSFTIKDYDTPLGASAQDERWVYDNPSIMFVSSTNNDAVTTWGKSNYQVIAQGDDHPNEDLAATWKFYSSFEFHNIAACYTANATYDTKVPNGFAANNTALFEATAACNISQFSTISEDGYLNMWVQKVATMTTGTWGSNVEREYGTAAFYTSKFSATQDDSSKCWASNNARILPGTRVETRARITGQKKGINTAIWMQGAAASSLAWPLYGEVDIMENPAATSSDNTTHYTYHMGSSDGGTYQNPTYNNTITDQSDFNIYWFEFIDESTVAIGVNGETVNKISKSDYSGIWPFDTTTNPYGLYYILTFGVANEWALGTVTSGWDSGFSSYTNYTSDRFNENLPRMEIDWVRFYKTSSSDVTQPVNTSKYY